MNAHEPAYVLGHDEREIRRLELQGEYLADLTRGMLARAGLGKSMRVLDFGAGAGDVSLLASDLVGPTGEVVAIDRSRDVLTRAEARVRARGKANVWCLATDEERLAELVPPASFDALVGRLVLLHQPNMEETLARLVKFVRPGGLVAFHEIDIEAGFWSEPRLPLFEKVWDYITETFQRTGMSASIGRRLSKAFDEVGLRPRRIVREGLLEDGSQLHAHAFLAETMRSLLPLAERFGIVTAAEIGIDTLAERLREESAGAHWVPVHFVAAWGRMPRSG